MWHYMFRSLVPISIQTVFPEDGKLAPKHVGDTSLIFIYTINTAQLVGAIN